VEEGSCAATSGCDWDDVSCNGTYFESCAGNFDTGACTGNFDNGACTGIYNNQICVGTPDNVAPTITNITSDKANDTYTVGEVIDIDVTFSETVTSTGNVTVTLETGVYRQNMYIHRHKQYNRNLQLHGTSR